jgi:hypothetical protein
MLGLDVGIFFKGGACFLDVDTAQDVGHRNKVNID